jgi:hypothetical protein
MLADMLEKILHRRLLEKGERGKGVVTRRRDQVAESSNSVYSIRFELRGHVKFPDGTESQFRSEMLSSHKVGDLREGAIVPVRYDADDHSKVVIDVIALEEKQKAKVQQQRARIEQRKQQAIAEAEAKLAQRNTPGDGSRYRSH